MRADGPQETCAADPPWQSHHADFRRPPARRYKVRGGCVVRDANGQGLAYVYDNEAEARQAKMLTKDEARRIAINVARLPELLGKG